MYNYAHDVSNIYVGESSYTGEGIFDGHGTRYFLLSVNDFQNNHNEVFISPFKISQLLCQFQLLTLIGITTVLLSLFHIMTILALIGEPRQKKLLLSLQTKILKPT